MFHSYINRWPKGKGEPVCVGPLTLLVDGIDLIFGFNNTTFVSSLGLPTTCLKISFS